MQLIRQLTIGINGVRRRGELRIGDLKECRPGRWACYWSITFLGDDPSPIYGEDPLQALTRCLFFLEQFVRGSERDGVEIWWQSPGDHAGL